jgi:hypothetical protein
MMSPGALVPAHAQLAGDCFACHAPFGGAASDRCVKCHAVADIGLRTTSGAPVAPNSRAVSASFHQALLEQNCRACHSDHGRQAARRFSHGLLPPAVGADCVKCHAAPTDAFHGPLTATCTQCHTQERWKPSTFKHDQFFVLDRDHATACATCHADNDLKRYTCFGCHEHSEASLRAEHEEEGIRTFDDCVSCHRSAEGEGGEGRERGEGGEEHEGDER